MLHHGTVGVFEAGSAYSHGDAVDNPDIAAHDQCGEAAFRLQFADHVENPFAPEDLKAHVKQAIAPYKYPREIAFVDALPKTATGKLQRFALRETDAPRP